MNFKHEDTQAGFQTPTMLEQLDGNPTEGFMAGNGVRQFPDGSVVVGEQPNPGMFPDGYNAPDHDANLAMGVISESELREIGFHLKSAIEEDKESQEQFYQAIATIIELLGLDSAQEAGKQDTFSNGSTELTSSALFETLLDLTATVMASLIPSTGMVDSVILGESNDQLADIAYRKKAWFNYFFERVDKGFDKELKRTIVWAILAGSIYRKVYIDTILGRPTARFIKVEDFIVNRDISSHLAASRKTQVHHMDKREFDLRKAMGEYKDESIIPSDNYNEGDDVIQEKLDEISGYDPYVGRNNRGDQDQYDIYESHVDYRIKSDPMAQDFDIPLPYIITLDAQSGKVLRITRNWKEGDFLKKKKEYFVNYSLLPSLDGEGYGLVQYAGKQAKAATEITRQLITAGLYSNFPGGVYQSGLRLENNNIRPMPGEFIPLATGGIPIDQTIMPLPYKEPSTALNDLKNQIEDNIKKPSAIINQKVSEMTPRAPMGSVLAMLESLQKVPNALVQGFHKSFECELELFNDRFAEWLPEGQSYPFAVPGGSHTIMKADFQADIQVIPASDPSLQNSTYRFMRAEIILNNARQGEAIHDMRYANQLFYKNLGVSPEEIQQLLPPPAKDEPPPPLDPISENQHLLTGKPVTAGIMQEHDAHMAVHSLLTQDQSTDPQVMAAAHAHVQEHLALKFLVEMQAKIGFEMPPDPTKIPPEQENQIAIAAAQVAQQKLAEIQAQQGAPQPDPAVITAQALTEEVKLKGKQNEDQNEIDKKKLEIEEQKVQGDLSIRQQELQLKSEIELYKNQLAEKKLELDAMSKHRDHLQKEMGSLNEDKKGLNEKVLNT